jgi:hypothetical protein
MCPILQLTINTQKFTMKVRKSRMSAFEELKVWCEKHNISCEFWESDYSSNLCARFCDDVLIFDKNGKFLTID